MPSTDLEIVKDGIDNFKEIQEYMFCLYLIKYGKCGQIKKKSLTGQYSHICASCQKTGKFQRNSRAFLFPRNPVK